MKEIEVSVVSIWRRDTQPNDVHYNDTHHNDEKNTLLSTTTPSITITFDSILMLGAVMAVMLSVVYVQCHNYGHYA